ncbi:hypothetical protein CLU95_3059 [Variovorax sp. 54]|uniref:hypothetical protein n=1 Tax=Variovorax sp. 54 TaxID=2035212 RepID=UPI000C3D21F3|nr:hypothetical protein [Variovorax sp. 54]PIF75906.1 hypothetical protein CLU95_3059 [Variovorax sp. 54]
MSSKPNIKSFSRIYRYLQDPALRTRETGDALLTIEGAEFSGLNLQGLVWRHVKFVNCDFAGAYEIKLDRLEKSTFEHCKFVGIHGFGDMVDVTLHRCAFGGETYVMGYSDSKRLVFDECNFVGTDSNRNHWGAVGGYGEAEFVRCKGKWFDLSGLTKLTIRDCEFETVSSKHDPREVANVHAPVLIERSKLRGSFNMVASSIQSLIIRDTVIDTLGLTGATIKEELLMERVRGGSVEAIVKGAQRLTVRDSQFTPPTSGGKFVFNLASNDAQEVLIENTSVLGDNILVDIGGGPHTESLVFRKSKFTRLDLQYAHAKHLLLENFEANSVRLNDARIGKLELSSAVFSLTLDLSNTQVHEFKKTGGTNLKKLGGLKLDGSNIKLPQ